MPRTFKTHEEAEAWWRSWEELKPNQMALWSSISMSCPCAMIDRLERYSDCNWDCGAPTCSCRYDSGEDCKWRGHKALMNAITGSRRFGYLTAMSTTAQLLATAANEALMFKSSGLQQALGILAEQFDQFVKEEDLKPFDHDASWALERELDGE